jgi:hypothetical protein
MSYKKIYNPTIRIAFKREDNTVKLDYKQLVTIIRTIVFDKQFLVELKEAMRDA